MPEIDNMKHLRWQCRRGVKELDAVLCAFLDNSYVTASVYEQHLFAELLTLEDDRLLSYFFAHSPAASQANENPENAELRQFIEKIRTAFVG
ncbi:MAG: succinate dehydrogenase assembly factor 2 [Methyloprofundus sp.]|nr:succinate dehydrogenase assembly factor 2 [Methyloprofundus sp.]